MARKDALIKDIAKLFVKYDLADWQVAIDVLRAGGPEYEPIGRAIEELASKPRTRPKQKKRPNVEQVLSDLEKTKPQKAAVLRGVRDRLTKKEMAPRLADLRELCLRLGIKDSLPTGRDAAVAFIIQKLVNLDENALSFAIKQIPAKDRNLQDEYDKWFQMIYSSR